MHDTQTSPHIAPAAHITRDGMVSVTALMEPAAVDLRVTTAEALAWARSNRIALPDSEPLIAVNAARDRLGLPQFKVTDDTTLRQALPPQKPARELTAPSQPTIVAS